MTCWLAQFSDQPCDGRLVRCHLLSQQTIKREFKYGAVLLPNGPPWCRRWPCFEVPDDANARERRSVEELLGDPRGWVWGCGGPCGNGGHHGMLDVARTLRIPRSALPSQLEEFVAELGLDWWLAREYGLAEAA